MEALPLVVAALGHAIGMAVRSPARAVAEAQQDAADAFQRVEAAVFGLPSSKRATVVAGHTALMGRDWPELWPAFALSARVEAPTTLAAPPASSLGRSIEQYANVIEFSDAPRRRR